MIDLYDLLFLEFTNTVIIYLGQLDKTLLKDFKLS